MGTIITGQFPLVVGFEPIDTSGDDGIARQRAFVGDSENDE